MSEELTQVEIELAPKNLCQRLVGVMAYMGAIGKGGNTTYGERYAYHKIDDIDDKLREALIENGIVAVISKIDSRPVEHVSDPGRDGKLTWCAECLITITLINADNPVETLDIVGWGQGIDYSDKATGKAISYAAKAAYLSAFHLRGQPDNEQDNIRRPVRPKPPKGVIVEEKTFDGWSIAIAESATKDALKKVGVELAQVRNSLTRDEVAMLQQIYAARQQELKSE